MAEIVRVEIVSCPDCGGQARMEIYSCGCKIYAAGGNHAMANCPGRKSDFFYNSEIRCGQRGITDPHLEKTLV